MSSQQILLGSGAAVEKTYVEEVFSSNVWRGNGANQAILNGINNKDEGGMVWLKATSTSGNHFVYDTVRGDGQSDSYTRLEINNGDAAGGTHNAYFGEDSWDQAQGYKTGYSVTGASGDTYVGYNFRKAKGFFTICQWTGDGSSSRAISHDLGCVPGMIVVKRLNTARNWRIYHRESYTSGNTAGTGYLGWNSNEPVYNNNTIYNGTPTATTFTVGNETAVNNNGDSYIAYLWAGGESTDANAKSIDFDGSGDYLSVPASTDLDMGTGDFTIEFWYKGKNTNTSNRQGIIASNTTWQSGFTQIQVNHPSHQNHIVLWDYDIDNSNPVIKSTNAFPSNGTWRHVALTRSSGALRLFVNGTLEKFDTQNGSLDFSDGNGTLIGYNPSDTGLNASLSNLRVVKGTAVYTSSFRPPTKPLTNITNTKLLCCQTSTVTAAAVIPSGSITTNGDPTSSNLTPFDDPASFLFGKNKESIVKCGRYKGNGSATGPIIEELGWEPQWVMLKRISNAEDWIVLDDKRGIYTDKNDKEIRPNANTAEEQAARSWIDLTPRGFQLKSNPAHTNGDGEDYIYIAIRRPDGYVSNEKPDKTKIFTPTVGSSGAPMFKSNGFQVDFSLEKNSTYTSGTSDWNATARLLGAKQLTPNNDGTGADNTYRKWDYDSGVSSYTGGSGIRMSYLWKRSVGLDTVVYHSNGTAGYTIPHNLGGVPEMIWIKCVTNNEHWVVGHKGLDGGNAPWTHYLRLNENLAEADSFNIFNDTAPNSSHFTVGDGNWTNLNNQTFIAYLFRSISGISSVGSYAGSGSTGNAQTLGFQPRFLIIKRVNATEDWFVFDSVNGFDKYMQLNSDQQRNTQTYVNVSSTGFSLVSDYGSTNESGSTYIYYAHA